jgi:hypothetical protein
MHRTCDGNKACDATQTVACRTARSAHHLHDGCTMVAGGGRPQRYETLRKAKCYPTTIDQQNPSVQINIFFERTRLLASAHDILDGDRSAVLMAKGYPSGAPLHPMPQPSSANLNKHRLHTHTLDSEATRCLSTHQYLQHLCGGTCIAAVCTQQLALLLALWSLRRLVYRTTTD